MSWIYFLPIVVVVFGLIGWFLYDGFDRQKLIVELSKMDTEAIVDHQKKVKGNTPKKNLSLKLIQSGLTQKEYNEGRFAFFVLGLFTSISLPILYSWTIGSVGVLVGVVCIIWGGELLLFIAKGERKEKINSDLGTFLNLVNVILEAGGGLKNAFFQVSRKAKNIINDELLKEVAILEYEMTNYSTKKAYENLKQRVDSDEMAKIVDFLVLSEETGIGVKNVFAAQSNEMHQEKFYKIKGKVNTLNLYLVLVIFVFVMPSIGAFIMLPMMDGKLSLGL